MKLRHFMSLMRDEGVSSRHEKRIVFILIMGLLVMLVIALYLPDKGPETIKRLLSEQGYSVEEIVFEKIQKDKLGFRERMYQSSVPIEYESGVFVDKWILSNVSISNYFSNWVVSPYPPLLNEPVSINVKITISRGQLQALQENLDGASIEQYVSEMLRKSIEEEKLNE